jgi:hypothetical protein
MTDSIYTIAMFIISAGMTTIAGISAYLYRQRDGQFDAAARRCNELAEETDQYETALATSEATVKGLRETQAQLERIISALSAERSSLYFRNAKGQIEPINPNPRKAHTLKHGMTVKDPTPEQAKQIFAEANKAGILWHGTKGVSEINPWIWYYEAGSEYWDGVTERRCDDIDGTFFITATEFIRRIRGEQE